MNFKCFCWKCQELQVELQDSRLIFIIIIINPRNDFFFIENEIRNQIFCFCFYFDEQVFYSIMRNFNN